MRNRSAAQAASGENDERAQHGRNSVRGRRTLRRALNEGGRYGTRALALLAAAALVVVGGVASGAQPPNQLPEPLDQATGSDAAPDNRAPDNPTPDNPVSIAPRAGDCRDGAVDTGAIFNNPHHDNADDRKILEHLECLIEGTPPGQTIRGATYHFADDGLLSEEDEVGDGVVDALIDAVQRGVQVKIVVDWSVANHDGTDREFFDSFEEVAADQDNGSFIRGCEGHHRGKDDYDHACIADRKMHNKLFTFSETHGVSNVTFLTTSNLEDDAINHGHGNSGTDMWNSGYTAAEDPALYGRFVDYHEDLARSEEDLDYHDELPDGPVGNYRIFHSPRSGGNTVTDILDNVGCPNGGSDDATIVRVSMLSFSNTGGFGPAIADRLRELDNEGCYVDIVANEIGYDSKHPEYSENALRTLLRKPKEDSAGGFLYHGPEVREFNGKRRHGLHDKNLMIDGEYAGKGGRKIVFTGSFNFTRPSVAEAGKDEDGDGYRDYKVNDETWLQINDPGVHDRFVDNFEIIRNAAHTCWQTSKKEGCDQGRTVDPDPDPADGYNCHETADKYQGADYLYLYKGTYCDGPNDAKDRSGADSDWGDEEGQIQKFDNEADSIVNTTKKHMKFYNYPNYNEGHPEGDSFCVRPDQWVNRISKYSDGGHESWSNSISSHRVVDDPDRECDRWFGGYHEPTNS